MDWKKEYQKWKTHNFPFDYIREDMFHLSKEEAKEQFATHMSFGTGGVRGTFGVGPNRMNHYTIKRITDGLKDYLLKDIPNAKEKGVAICYDTRYLSKEFADVVANGLIKDGFNVYLSDEARPTPILSYMVRIYQAVAGVMITASHNPSNYNGYKIYDATGGQITEHIADRIKEELKKKPVILEESFQSFDISKDKYLKLVGEEIEESYFKEITLSLKHKDLFAKKSNFKIIYSPLHGTGLKLIKESVEKLGYQNLSVVEEQTSIDGSFHTVKLPNPEEKTSFIMAEQLGEKKGASLLLATDPDCDRIGVVVKDKNQFVYLNGNQVGALLVQYLIENNNEHDLNHSVLIKTIVTSELGAEIAMRKGIAVENTLTGFKYIGEKITQMEEEGKQDFLFGYEESFGYLFNPIVRDKDAVQTALLIIEASLYYDERGLSLVEKLDEIYDDYGYFADELIAVQLKNNNEKAMVEKRIDSLRGHVLKEIGGFPIIKLEDYLLGKASLIDGTVKKLELPTSNVLKFVFKDHSWVALRPSGTEPKFKIYFSIKGKDKNEAGENLNKVKKEVLNFLEIGSE